jgi:DNA-binding PadR family transcriptional regulator
MRREQLKGHLDMLLLSVLSGGPAHGYAVITRLRDRSEGGLDLPEGTIYPALHRLEDAGLINSRWSSSSGRRRRIYEIAAPGVRALVDMQSEWRSFAATIQAVIGSPA